MSKSTYKWKTSQASYQTKSSNTYNTTTL